jgi:hypothetical protein
MAGKKFAAGIGKTRVVRSKFPSEAGLVREVQQNMRDMERRIFAILDDVVEATPEIMLEAMKPIKAKAIYYCPKDTGALRSSAYLEITSFRGNPRVEIGFGRGGNPFYAIYVHEVLEHHHEAPTQAKFLERAVYEDLQGLRLRLEQGYRRLLNE